MQVLIAFALFLLHIIEGIISLALTLFIVIPSLILLYLINQSIRGVIYIILKAKGSNSIRLSSHGLDNIWGYKTPSGGNSRNVLFIAIYQNRIDGFKYREKFLSHVVNFTAPDGTNPYLKLKKIFTKAYGYYAWKDDEAFDIANHVVVLPEDKVVNESEMLNMLGELIQDMSEEHPQWQEIIIPRFKYDMTESLIDGTEKSCRILRFHHSYGDAGSWILLYSYCMAGGEIPYAVNPLKGIYVPLWKKILYYINAFVFGATTALRATWEATFIRNRFVTMNYSGKKHFVWSQMLDLNIIKDIKKKTGTCIPTILASLLGGALRKFDVKYPLKKGQKGLGDTMGIGAVAAILPYPNFFLQNRFTIVNFMVPTGKLSPLARLNLSHETGLALARSPEPLWNFYLFKFFGMFPAKMQTFMMQSCGTSLIFSNLPGASETFYLWGDAVADGGAWVPLLTVAGLSISAAGYKDGLRLCGVTDSACMSEVQLKTLLDDVGKEALILAEETAGLC